MKRSILVRAKPADVFNAFEEEKRVQAWYFDDAHSEFFVGGQLTFQGLEGAVTAHYLAIESPTTIQLAYDAPWWGVVTWRLEGVGEGTRVHLLHEGFEGHEEWLDRFSWGWEAFMKALKAHAEGRPVK